MLQALAIAVAIAGPNGQVLADPAAPPPGDPTGLYAPDPAAAPTPADAARGWDEAPVESRNAVWRGLGAATRGLVAVLAAPFRGAAWLEDRHHAFSRTRDLFYNADHTAGVVPSVTLESGSGIAVGANAFHANVLGHGERVSVRGSYANADRYAAQLEVTLPRWFDRVYANGRLRYEAADNLVFAGIGNADNGITRYGEQRTLASASTGLQLGKLRVGATYIYNDRVFDQDVAAGATPIGQRYDTAMLAGFADGVQLHEVTGDVELDLRDHPGPSGSGIRFAGFGGRGFGDGYAFTHWGAEATAYITPWRARRVLVLRIAHEGVQGDVPFTDLPRLGGLGLLRGFRRDQFRDELAAIGTVEYRYPIHEAVSGTLFVETGKVARTYDELASHVTSDWHVGYGGGLLVHSRDSIALTLQLAYGDGLQVLATTDVLQAFRRRAREL